MLDTVLKVLAEVDENLAEGYDRDDYYDQGIYEGLRCERYDLSRILEAMGERVPDGEV